MGISTVPAQSKCSINNTAFAAMNAAAITTI